MGKNYNKNHPRLATIYNNIGMLYIDIRNLKVGISYLEKALIIRQKFYGDNHIETLESYANIELAYKYLGKIDKATEYKKYLK